MRIRSIIDVITNSSSEVFVFKLDDSLYPKANSICSFDEYPDLESIKKEVLGKYYYGWEDLYYKFGYNGPTPTNDIFSDPDIEKSEENWERYKNLYESLVGYAFLEIDRDSDECSEIRHIIHEDWVKKNILPIIEKLEIGKKYEVDLSIIEEFRETVWFIWEGKPEIIVHSDMYEDFKEINIKSLLCCSKLDTFHES